MPLKQNQSNFCHFICMLRILFLSIIPLVWYLWQTITSTPTKLVSISYYPSSFEAKWRLERLTRSVGNRSSNRVWFDHSDTSNILICYKVLVQSKCRNVSEYIVASFIEFCTCLFFYLILFNFCICCININLWRIFVILKLYKWIELSKVMGYVPYRHGIDSTSGRMTSGINWAIPR